VEAPTPISMILAGLLLKMGGYGLLRLSYPILPHAGAAYVVAWVLGILGVINIIYGALCALAQDDFKKLVAYSSISHMGFALVGLAAGTAVGVQAMLTYMAIYVVMNVGTFAFILAMEKGGKHVTDLADLNQIARREPGKALALLILMFSLAGVPPTLGFFAKFTVLKAAVDAGMSWLALLGVIASVIGAFYYLRVVYYMYFGAEREGLTLRGGVVQWAILAGSALVMVLGVVNLLGMEGAAALAAEALVR